MKDILTRFLTMTTEQVLDLFAALPGAQVYEDFIYIPGTREQRLLLVGHADTVFHRPPGRVEWRGNIAKAGWASYSYTPPAKAAPAVAAKPGTSGAARTPITSVTPVTPFDRRTTVEKLADYRAATAAKAAAKDAEQTVVAAAIKEAEGKDADNKKERRDRRKAEKDAKKLDTLVRRSREATEAALNADSGNLIRYRGELLTPEDFRIKFEQENRQTALQLGLIPGATPSAAPTTPAATTPATPAAPTAQDVFAPRPAALPAALPAAAPTAPPKPDRWHPDPSGAVGYETAGWNKKNWSNGYSNANGLGADDRAGIAMLWLLRRSGHSLLITDKEECGGGGAKSASRALAAELGTHQFAIEIDRHFDQEMVFYRVSTPEFERYMVEQTGGFRIEQGSYTDISDVCAAAGICGVNLAAGYWHQHSADEMLNYDAWLRTYNIVHTMCYRREHARFALPENRARTSYGRGASSAGFSYGWEGEEWDGVETGAAPHGGVRPGLAGARPRQTAPAGARTSLTESEADLFAKPVGQRTKADQEYIDWWEHTYGAGATARFAARRQADAPTAAKTPKVGAVPSLDRPTVQRAVTAIVQAAGEGDSIVEPPVNAGVKAHRRAIETDDDYATYEALSAVGEQRGPYAEEDDDDRSDEVEGGGDDFTLVTLHHADATL